MKKYNQERFFAFINKHTWIVCIFFVVLVFLAFRDLFSSYFESDEWFHFTYYFPLTRQPNGFFTAIASTFIDTGPLSGGQHVVPVASAIFFLNTYFFGLFFPPYAFMSLMVHSVNTFLVYYMLGGLLQNGESRGIRKLRGMRVDDSGFDGFFKRSTVSKTIPFLSGVFFALSPVPMHAVTGAAPFYGQNVLSVTFFLLCIITFNKAFSKKSIQYLYSSILFLFLALFTKETTAFLFFLLPCLALMEKRVFPLRYLTKIFAGVVILYAIIRFIIPGVLTGAFSDAIADQYIASAPKNVSDTGTVVSQDTSIHENIYTEILFRSMTFPVKMAGSLFIPRSTLNSALDILTPVIYPLPGSGEELAKSQNRVFFRTGPGNDFLLYIISLGVLFLSGYLVHFFYKNTKKEMFKTIMTGLLIVVFSAIPLVAIVLSFPRWGYDTYFDSRFYYNPNVGAAILFPFFLLALAYFFSRLFRIRNIWVILVLLFSGWFINSLIVFNQTMYQLVYNTGLPRREIISQLRSYLQKLPQKTVFYIETDGLGAYGPVLPFQTSVPQALAIAYYDRSPLPDSFFAKPLFDGKPQGYMFREGRGFGYYTSKKTLSEEIGLSNFKPADLYTFYYDSQQIKIVNTTGKIREEMVTYIRSKNSADEWKKFTGTSSAVISFYYPQDVAVEEIGEDESSYAIQAVNLSSFEVSARLTVLILPNISLSEFQAFASQGMTSVVNLMKVVYDTYHSNDALVIDEDGRRQYVMKLADKVIQLEMQNASPEGIRLAEKILGSVEVTE